MSYSELPDISSKLSKGTAAAAILCHEFMETDGQDEHVCYLDNFLKKLLNFLLEFGSKFGFGYKPQKQTNKKKPDTKKTAKKQKQKKLNFF